MPALFDTVINIGSTGSPFTTNNTEIGGAFGARTIVYLTINGSLTFVGLNPTNGPVDKAAVTIVNISNSGSATANFAHESSSATALRNRMWQPGLAAINTGTGIGGAEYVYNANVQRWICVARTQ